MQIIRFDKYVAIGQRIWCSPYLLESASPGGTELDGNLLAAGNRAELGHLLAADCTLVPEGS